jgi:hypothetical protein
MYPLAGAILIRTRPKWIVLACGLVGVVAVVPGFMLLPRPHHLCPLKLEWAADALCYGEDGGRTRGGVIVPLTEKDFADHLVFGVVIRGEEWNPSAWEWGTRDRRAIGSAHVSYSRSKVLHDAYGPG